MPIRSKFNGIRTAMSTNKYDAKKGTWINFENKHLAVELQRSVMKDLGVYSSYVLLIYLVSVH